VLAELAFFVLAFLCLPLILATGAVCGAIGLVRMWWIKR